MNAIKKRLEKAPALPRETPVLDGFDAELSDKVRLRISSLVDDYQKIIINHLEDEYTKSARRPEKLADMVAFFGGSWKFIIIMVSALSAWMLWNSVSSGEMRFDPYPFILLNLGLSFLAAFQAPIIMMSQNRQAAKDKHEAIIDFAINYKAEQEVDDMQMHLHMIERDIAEIKEALARIAGKNAPESENM